MTVPLAAGSRLEPSAGLRTLDGGRILIGGSPFRILRLSAAGAELVRSWFAGQEVGDRAGHHELARRLEAGGLANVRWARSTPEPPVPAATVVIPTHDDRTELARTLAERPDRWAREVIVVDDGSIEPVEIEPVEIGSGGVGSADPSATAATGRTRVLRHAEATGPGPARQTGLAAAGTELVVLVDAGVVLDPDTAIGLLRAFDDPNVVAAAPRVLSPERADLVGRYDHHRSPLDLGPGESLVGPGRAVPYVPTACLAVRADAVERAGGFDPALRYGEDVDLVWRLGQLGHVRYLPHLTVTHPARTSLRALAAQRRSYGSAAAPLATRHGTEALTPCRVSPWTLVVVALGLGGRPVLAGLTAVGTGLALKRKIEPMPAAGAEAMALTLRGHGYGALSVLTAVARSWAPLLGLVALLGPRGRRLAALTGALAAARRVVDGPRRPVDAAIDVAVGVVDDLAYCDGLWRGALAERSTAALRPVVADWPGSDATVRDRLTAGLAAGRRWLKARRSSGRG